MLMELANQTVAAAEQRGVGFRFGCRIREVGGADGTSCVRQVSVSMRGLNRRSVNNETEQQQREHASERAMRSD